MNLTPGLILATTLMISAGEAPETNKELARFQGKWSVSKLTFDGQGYDSLVFHFQFKGDEAVMEGDDAIMGGYSRVKLKPDLSTTPKALDITVSGGTKKGAIIEGIYELKGEELWICAKIVQRERPTEFTSPTGAGIVLIVLNRAKQ